jgi:threonyl-tRNA synthetase
MTTMRDTATRGIVSTTILLTADGGGGPMPDEHGGGRTGPPALSAYPAHLGWVERPAAAAPGQVAWTAKGRAALARVEDWIRTASAARLGGEEVATPLLYSWERDSPLVALAGTFEDRLYLTEGPDRQVLRWNADPGLFALLTGRRLAPEELPLRVWELGRCYRRHQSGERRGIRRMDEFTLHDHHAVCGGEQSALDEYRRLFAVQLDLIGTWTDRFTVNFTVTHAAYEQRERYLRTLASDFGVDLRVRVESGPRHYWDMKHVIVTGGGLSTFNTQFDVDNAARFALDGTGPSGQDGLIILHTSLAAAERLLLVAVDEAVRSERRALPLWLSDVQLRLLPTGSDLAGAARQWARELAGRGVRTDVDARSQGLGRRARRAVEDWVPLTAVVGAQEVAAGRLTVRDRAGAVVCEGSPAEAAALLAAARTSA